MPRLHAKHRTELTYHGTARESVNEVRLTPRAGRRQQVQEAVIRVDPEVEVSTHRDAFGNDVCWFQVVEAHAALVIEAEAVVDVSPRPAPTEEGGWPALQARAYADDLAEYLVPSTLVRWGAAVQDLAREIDLARGDAVVDWVDRLERSVHDAIEYERGHTAVDTPVEQVVEARRGVCQDMAHLAIALCRRQGVAARYVSGWLFQPGRDDPGESHAWCEAALPGGTWREIDATRPGGGKEHYIRLAVGRDYADVAPIRGSYVGGATTSMDVTVQVRAIDERPESEVGERSPV